MTFVDLAKVSGQIPDNSQLLVCEQATATVDTIAEAWKDTGRRKADIYKYIPGIVSGDLGDNSTLIDNPVMSGGRDPLPGIPNKKLISGGIVVLAGTIGSGWLYRNLMQDRKPTVTGSDTNLNPPNASVTTTDTEKSAVAFTVQAGKYGRIKATPAAAVRVGTSGFASLIVYGKAADDSEISDEITWTGSGALSAKWGEVYFKDIDAYGWRGFSTGGAITITSSDTSRTVVFEPDDDKARSFVTLEFAKGDDPETIYSAFIMSDRIDVRNDGIMTHQLAFGARDSEPEKNLGGTTGKTDITADLNSGTKVFAGREPFAGWQVAVRLGGGSNAPRMAMRDASLILNNNWQFSSVIPGGDTEGAPPIAINKRDIMINANVLKDSKNRYDSYFRQNRQIEYVQFIMENKIRGAYPSSQIIECRAMELKSNPNPSVQSGQEVSHAVNLSTVKRDGAKGVKITCVFPEWADVQDLSGSSWD